MNQAFARPPCVGRVFGFVSLGWRAQLFSPHSPDQRSGSSTAPPKVCIRLLELGNRVNASCRQWASFPAPLRWVARVVGRFGFERKETDE